MQKGHVRGFLAAAVRELHAKNSFREMPANTGVCYHTCWTTEGISPLNHTKKADGIVIFTIPVKVLQSPLTMVKRTMSNVMLDIV